MINIVTSYYISRLNSIYDNDRNIELRDCLLKNINNDLIEKIRDETVELLEFMNKTNIDDIETYIKRLESNGKTYLTAIDLPIKERDKVILELQHMGITPGSLFSGYDGTCEEIKQRLFKI